MIKPRVSPAAAPMRTERLEHYRQHPERGPRVLFFSGGSALNPACDALKRLTHNSIHLVTPFDSGGSSAELRKAFGMPAIGDLRNRLLSLTDVNQPNAFDVLALFNRRLPDDASPPALLQAVQAVADGHAPEVGALAPPMRQLLLQQLNYFLQAMPADFDLRGASLGNLVLAGGYLIHHHQLDPTLRLFARLANVQGDVRATVNDSLHLGAVLENGETLLGQHRLTGKQLAPIRTPVQRVFLNDGLDAVAPTSAQVPDHNRTLIEQADLICYPPGSFYSSLIANLLPQGIGAAVARNPNPKVYLPNLGQDPEQLGMRLETCVSILLETLRADAPQHVACDFLNVILVDTRHARYPWPIATEAFGRLGIQVIDTPLISPQSAPYYDPELMSAALLSLA